MTTAAAPSTINRSFSDREKPQDTRISNISAAKAVASAIRSSLGPKGMDKMIQNGDGEVVISNDGATILKLMAVIHPCAKMLVELSAAQDVEAGDGTTSVVVLAGSILNAADKLLRHGIHASQVSAAFLLARDQAVEMLRELSIPVNLSDRDCLIKSAATSLNSKIVAQSADRVAGIAVDAVLRVIDTATARNVDLGDIRVIKKVGGTIDEMELVDGLILNQEPVRSAGGPVRIENAKIGLIQFQLSAPKTDMDNQVVVTDYRQMDRILREERAYLLELCKKIKKANCTVLLVQKSILRDAVSELALHFLAKLRIMVVTDIERGEIEYLAKSLGCRPVADVESFTEDKLGVASLVEEVPLEGSSYICISGIAHPHRTVSVLCRGANSLILEEVERSLHDALCVVRCLVKERAFVVGGGAPEAYLSWKLSEYARTLSGVKSLCIQLYAEALDVIPYTLAENAGYDAVTIVTELKNRHARGEVHSGINVRKGIVSDLREENVVQPLLVTISAIQLATETAAMILKIDDIVQSR